MTPETTKVLEEALQMQDLPQEQQEELLIELSELVSEGALLRITERMSEEVKEEFSALLDTDPEDEVVEGFIAKHVPEADAIVEETLQDIRDDILAVTGESQD